MAPPGVNRVEPGLPLACSVFPSLICQQQIYLGFFCFPVLERFGKNKMAFQRYHLCSCSLQSNSKVFGLTYSFLRQNPNKCHQRTHRGWRKIRRSKRPTISQENVSKGNIYISDCFFLSRVPQCFSHEWLHELGTNWGDLG